MKRLTAGIARDIVDTSTTAGEAWHQLTNRFYGRNVQGATSIASQLQELKRLTQNRIFSLAERDQEVGQRICSTISRRTGAQRHGQSGLYESRPRHPPQSDGTQVSVDKIEPHNLEDKVFAFIRNNTSGTTPMDIRNIAPEQTPARHRHQALAVPVRVPRQVRWSSDSYPDLNNCEHASKWNKIGTLATPTHQEVQMASCTVCRKA